MSARSSTRVARVPEESVGAVLHDHLLRARLQHGGEVPALSGDGPPPKHQPQPTQTGAAPEGHRAAWDHRARRHRRAERQHEDPDEESSRNATSPNGSTARAPRRRRNTWESSPTRNATTLIDSTTAAAWDWCRYGVATDQAWQRVSWAPGTRTIRGQLFAAVRLPAPTRAERSCNVAKPRLSLCPACIARKELAITTMSTTSCASAPPTAGITPNEATTISPRIDDPAPLAAPSLPVRMTIRGPRWSGRSPLAVTSSPASPLRPADKGSRG